MNPWDKEDCTEALAKAVSMSADEARGRMRQFGSQGRAADEVSLIS